MKYDFDREIDRAGTHSAKWGVIQDANDPSRWHATDAYFVDDRVLPLWVADMDFASPPPVVEALAQRARHGIYGYTVRPESYDEAVVTWMARRQGWRVDPTWIVSTPGVIPALNLLVRTLVSPGDKVLIQRPVYYPFFGAIRNNGGQIVSSALVLRDGRYEMDFDDFETQAADPATSLFILCSPHNPVGRVWTRQELARIGEICLRHGVVVLADEIHGDLIYRGVEFTPLAALGDEVADNAVICTAPSKTFNLAGLHTSNIIVPNAGLRTRFERTLNACGLGRWASPFGMLACEVAYREGEPWLNQALAYIEANLELLAGFVGDRMPGVQLIRPEGTYLVWLDFRELGLSPADLRRLMLEQSRVFPDEGSIFGPEGDGFERLNIACPRSILNEALTRIARAVEALGPPSPASTSPNETTP